MGTSLLSAGNHPPHEIVYTMDRPQHSSGRALCLPQFRESCRLCSRFWCFWSWQPAGDPGNRIDQDPKAAGQIHTALPTPIPGPPATAVPVVSEATLPSLTVIHEGRTIQARRFEGCWTPDSSSDIQCVETSPRGEQQSYAEVESGDSIEIEITPDSRPTRLLATIFTQPGEVMVSDLLHLSPAERELVVDVPPGNYNVRLHAQWFEGGSKVHHKVNYVFGLTIPGEPELKRQCLSTAIGGIMGIVLESLDAPPQNGCRTHQLQGMHVQQTDSEGAPCPGR